MVSYTTRLAGRNTRDIDLTSEEAAAMLDRGFRFADFTPEVQRYRISRPYEVILVRDLDQLTIRQE